MEHKGYGNGPFSKEVQGVHCGETLKNNLCSTGPRCRGGGQEDRAVRRAVYVETGGLVG